MSHHFDTRLAREDPSLNVCDLYLFPGPGETTVMAMTVNPDVGLSSPDTLHPEGLYAFRFDLNGDAHEEVVFKFGFGAPKHRNGDEHVHVQPFQVRRATGDAIGGDGGELLVEGETGKTQANAGTRAYVGIAPDLFAGNAAGLHAFLDAFHQQSRFHGDAFLQGQNFFTHRNVTALVLEVPSHLIGSGKVHAWATVSLYGHAPEMQVSRWGLPHITNIFLNDPADPDLKEAFNRSLPSGDVASFARPVADFARKMTTYANSAASPGEYAEQLAARLCPAMLPYDLGTPAAFQAAAFNGRPLGDDAMDVMLTLAANQPIHDGASPDKSRIRDEFPYFGEAYSKADQQSVTPVTRPARK